MIVRTSIYLVTTTEEPQLVAIYTHDHPDHGYVVSSEFFQLATPDATKVNRYQIQTEIIR